MKTIENIKKKLTSRLNPSFIDIDDFSKKHAGHYFAEDARPSHISITIASDEFINLNKIERHRLINKILEQELKEHIHALRIFTLTTQEHKKTIEENKNK